MRFIQLILASALVACQQRPANTTLPPAADMVAPPGPGDTAGMVLIKGGAFEMGSGEFTDSRPVHTVV